MLNGVVEKYDIAKGGFEGTSSIDCSSGTCNFESGYYDAPKYWMWFGYGKEDVCKFDAFTGEIPRFVINIEIDCNEHDGIYDQSAKNPAALPSTESHYRYFKNEGTTPHDSFTLRLKNLESFYKLTKIRAWKN